MEQEMIVDNDQTSILQGKSISSDINITVSLLERAVSSLEPRFATRALRRTCTYRHSLNLDNLTNCVQKYVQDAELVKFLNSTLKINATQSTKTTVPEVEVFVGLLAVLFLLDQKQNVEGRSTALFLIERSKKLNRRTLDPIQARLFFYYGHFSQVEGKLADIQAFVIISHRTATLQANLIDQADKFVAKAGFPESASNNQFARYMYYIGRIKAIQLEYSSSHQCVLQAIRKAPQTDATVGFQQTTQKLSVIVQLLMGEIPERSLFQQDALAEALVPYFHITQAVRIGDLGKFQDALAKYSTVFNADKNMTLVLRLRHNVIKAGIRRISLAYSRISLKDICLKLQLDSEEDAEHIVAKAIRDGVIDASIDHKKGFMKSNEVLDIYSTSEPLHTFHQRISFCLNLYNESVQALRYPHGAHKKALAEAAELIQQSTENQLILDDDDMSE